MPTATELHGEFPVDARTAADAPARYPGATLYDPPVSETFMPEDDSGFVSRRRDGWSAAGVSPRPYASGTWGPSAAIALTERDGVSWHD